MYQRVWSPSYKKQLIYPIVGIPVHPYDMYIWRDRYIHNHTLHRYLDRYSWYSHREPVIQNSWWKYPPIAGSKTPSDHRRRRVPRGRGKKHWVSKNEGCLVPFPYPIGCMGMVYLPIYIWLLFMVNHGFFAGKYTNPFDPSWVHGIKSKLPKSTRNLHPNLPTEDGWLEADVFVHVHPDLMKHSGIKMLMKLSTLPMLNLVLLLQDQLRHGVLS